MRTLPYMQHLDWPVDHVATACVTADGVDTCGDQERVFQLASVTKVLSAYGFLIAVEEGVFDLDSPCGPSESACESATVRQFLSHASGVGMRESDRMRAPLERRIYSSYGFEILADVLEAETGISFPDYLSEAVFQPLNMSNTHLQGSAGHGAQSTAADLTAFIQELRDPALLSASTVQEAFTVQYPELIGVVPGYGIQKPNPWGLGFEIHGNKSPHWLGESMPADVVGHFGMSGTFLWFAPREQVGMVALTDRQFGEWAKPLWSKANDAVWSEICGSVGGSWRPGSRQNTKGVIPEVKHPVIGEQHFRINAVEGT